jgi:hypothetical protein
MSGANAPKITKGPWTYSKCKCGDPACKSFVIDHSGAEGMFSEPDAILITSANALLESVCELMDMLPTRVEPEDRLRLWKAVALVNKLQELL